jgi:hypothetical protein
VGSSPTQGTIEPDFVGRLCECLVRYDERTRAVAVVGAGESLSSVSRRLGVSRSALRAWRDCDGERLTRPECPRCAGGELASAAYAHLLGLYLGDGCLARHRRDVYALRISCDDRYPRLMDEAEGSILAVHLFPQHGPGRKHLRRIVLEDWQEEIVAECPEALLRGLFDSDGCGLTNWTTRTVGGQLKRYEYPRYLFANESSDIMRICQQTLDALGIPWRMPRPNRLSVAPREEWPLSTPSSDRRASRA